MNYQLYIFDLDGTILNSLGDLTDAVNHTLQSMGYPQRTMEEVRSFVGNGIRKLLERALPESCGVEETDRAYEIFYPYYQEHCADRTEPYEGIEALLHRLKSAGAKLAVVSNKADGAVQQLTKRYFDGIFDLAVGEKEGIRRKPAPDSVWNVLKVLQIEKRDAVYIGDSEVDIETAKNAGIDEIAVCWGFRPQGFLEENGARNLVKRPEEIF